MIRLPLAALCAATLLLTACSGELAGLTGPRLLDAERHDAGREDALTDDQRVQRLTELRKEVRQSPADADLKSRLRQLEEATSAHFLAAGNKLLGANRFAEATQQFELGLLASPADPALQEARVTALSRKEASRLYASEQRAKETGNYDLAEHLLEKANSLDRRDPAIKTEIRDIERKRDDQGARYLIKAFETKAPLAVNFRQAKLKEALQAVSEPHGLNFIFDQDVEELDLSVSARNVTFKQAFSMILQASDTAYKVIGPNSVLVYKNTPEKRAKYADLYFRTFHLANVKAERMAELLKSSMDLKTLVANNDLNTIQIRDTRESLDVIERLIASNDRAPAEIMLDVEILEINRSKAEQLGVDYGSQITLSPASAGATAGGIVAKQFVNGQLLRAVLGEASVSLPSLTLKYMQHDVDARTLAKPRVRTLDGKPAKIHVGDRVPLRSSTVQDVTGQSRTMYEYRDIGIKLDVLPRYHLDGSIAVELGLEVSALGSNLGTAAEPAYAIGTRNVNTTMLLREGETALLGGLIRDDERRAMNKVPGLAQLGVVGRLFADNDDSDARTDVILTITPKVIRDQSLPRHKDTNFYSGGHGNFTTTEANDYLKTVPSEAEPPRYQINPKNRDAVVQASGAEPSVIRGQEEPVRAAAAPARAGSPKAAGLINAAQTEPAAPWIGFGASGYSVQTGDAVAVELKAAHFEGGAPVRAHVLFNPDKLTLVTGQNGDGVTVTEDRDGVVAVEIAALPRSIGDKTTLARIKLKAKSAGLSYLLVSAPPGADGAQQKIECGASKIEVR